MSGPPPPPPPGPPPPAAPVAKPVKVGGGTGNRNALLSSIQSGTKLKKTVTVDKSKPLVGGSSSSSGGGAAPSAGGGSSGGGSSGGGGYSNPGPQLAGMFAGGFPKLKKTGRDGAASMVGSGSPAPAAAPAPQPVKPAGSVAPAPKKLPPPNPGSRPMPHGAKPAKSMPAISKQAPPSHGGNLHKSAGNQHFGAPPPHAGGNSLSKSGGANVGAPKAVPKVGGTPVPAQRKPSPNSSPRTNVGAMKHQQQASPRNNASPRAQTPGGGGGGGELVTALYDYQAVKNGELSMKKGDVIKVIEKKPSGWWKGVGETGSCVGKTGLLPGNYCGVVKRVQARYAYRAQKSDELTFNKGDVIIIRKEGKNWWIGELRGNIGAFPKNYTVDI